MKSLLIVDDNAAMRQMIRVFVAGVSDTIHECSNGAEAVCWYRAHRPDCVLMDWEMPVMDGLTATRRILEEFPAARVVLVTQYNDALLRRRAGQAGACHFIVKDNLLWLPDVLQGVKRVKPRS